MTRYEITFEPRARRSSLPEMAYSVLAQHRFDAIDTAMQMLAGDGLSARYRLRAWREVEA